MSFDANIGRPAPVIQAASSMNNDGGSGGNTGYMMRERKKKNKESYGSLFNDEKVHDSFELETGVEKTKIPVKNSWLENLLDKMIK